MEAVAIEALLLGNANGDVPDGIVHDTVEIDDVVVADAAVEAPDIAEAIDPVGDTAQSESVPASTNVGRGMRTDEI